MPLGFTVKGAEGIFVNDNSGILALSQVNTVAATKTAASDTDIFFRVIDQFVQVNQEITAKREIHNIQVIRRSDGKYVFNILSKEKLQVIQKCKNEFAKLVGISCKLQDDYLNIYRTVMQCILTGKNLYSLMHVILQTAIDKTMRIGFLRYLLKIQAVAFGEGEEKMREKAVFSAMKRGEELKAVMSGDSHNENKIRTLSYKLLNALKVRNSNEFMDLILRNYVGLGMQMPISFLEVLKDEKQFLDFGYAFVTGLNSGSKKAENEEENKQ